MNLSFTRLLSVFCELFPGEVNRMADPYRHLAAEEEPAKESKGWLWLLQTFSSVFMFGVAVFLLWNTLSIRSQTYRTERISDLSTELDDKQKQNNELREEVYSLHESLRKSKRFDAISVASNAVSPPDDVFVLIRTAHAIGAIKFEPKEGEFFPDRADRSSYEWYFSPDPDITHFDPDGQTGVGEVFEKYKRVETENGEYFTDDGSQLLVRFGTIHLKWSSGDWLYPKSPSMQFAVTTAQEIQQVRPQDPALMWIGRRTLGSSADD